MSALVASFYRFSSIDDPAGFREKVLAECQKLELRGTILIAAEGLNGSIAGRAADVHGLLDFLRGTPGFETLFAREATADSVPFRRLKVRVRPEIVTFRQPDARPTEQVGTYIAPRDWNALIRREDVTVIDTRNDFEVEMGTFKGAVDPQTRSFTDFADWIAQEGSIATDKPVAMFCTGGIRCEKATSHLIAQGFSEVYHLEGGILGYLDEVPESESLWEGECFVFDERISVGHNS